MTFQIHDCIMVVFDKLTKSAHFIPVKTTFEASTIAQIFLKKIIRFHGVPQKIISDRHTFYFQILEKPITIYMNTTKLQYNISPRDRWVNRKNKPSIRVHAKSVCHGSTKLMGEIPSLSGIFIQQ